jgi:hypothetical protein
MSWTFGGLLMQKDFSQHLDEFLSLVHHREGTRGSKISFNSALSVKGNEAALGVINHCTVLINEYLPYDCSFTPGKASAYDNRLAAASATTPILIFLLDGISGTYGYSLFQDGERIRRWAADPGTVLCDEGDPVEFEKAFIDDPRADSEQRVLAAIEHYLSKTFVSLIRDEHALLYKLV